MNTKNDEFKLLTENAAAEMLGFSIRALQQWRCNGKGPRFVKISSRAVRYRFSDLKEWAEARVCQSTSEYDYSSTRRVSPIDPVSIRFDLGRKSKSRR